MVNKNLYFILQKKNKIINNPFVLYFEFVSNIFLNSLKKNNDDDDDVVVSKSLIEFKTLMVYLLNCILILFYF